MAGHPFSLPRGGGRGPFRGGAQWVAAEAWERFEAEPFDLLITDYRMPRMNGIELIQKVRASGRTLPIILMSGVANALGLSEANTGADVVIQKSAHEVTQLLRATERLLKRKTPRKPAAKPAKPAAAEKPKKATKKAEEKPAKKAATKPRASVSGKTK